MCRDHAVITSLLSFLRTKTVDLDYTSPLEFWKSIQPLVRRNRLPLYVLQTLVANSRDPNILTQHDKYKNEIAKINFSIIIHLKKLHHILSEAAIPYVIYKGPVQQHLVHGDMFQRPSGDIDILVDKRYFAELRAALVASHHTLPDECDRIWWKYFLGEQHLLIEGIQRPTVDIHFRVQRPGCPQPANTAAFVHEKVEVNVAGISVPTPNTVNTMLVIAINLVKGIYDEEPCAYHAYDLYTLDQKLTPELRACLQDTADRQGLRKTLDFAMFAATSIFGLNDLRTTSSRHYYWDRDSLAALIIVPRTPTSLKPPRQVLLSLLSDNRGDYAKGLFWTFLSKVGRIID
ncbi:nucleotidyltransferase family protein [Agrobacterium cavarae]|uniref:nucleotidyltransferase family protein n=1 Tax=Agrobacterium cavarae TaxID=2528239 RepID=UPI0028A81172|nr:nucleotidyltransferase family protein [Agrobacterium cavarae]